MNIQLSNKSALVTGAGKGIGRALAKALVECGAETYALSRTQSDLDSLKQECASIHTVCVDLADWDATRKAVQNLGVIDLLVNNAAVLHLDAFLEVKQEDLERSLNVNLKAVFNVSQVVAKGMVEKGKGGSIVNISGTASQTATPKFVAYGCSKAGMNQLTRVMALELGPHQIRVNTVTPTVVQNELTERNMSDPVLAHQYNKLKERIPVGKFAEVKDVVHPVLYLLSDQSDIINGATLMVDGGQTIC